MVRRAAVFGCNYAGSAHALHGCINDAHAIYEMLVYAYQFDPQNIQMLTDDRDPKPTGANMKQVIARKVQESGPGDVLFIHYSGHGTQVPITDNDPNEEEDDGLDEAICPCDMNLLMDDDWADLLAPLNHQVKCTIVADCCHSGTLLDYGQIQLDLGNAALAGQFTRESISRAYEATPYAQNRSMPMQMVANVLSGYTGRPVPYTAIFGALQQTFGPAASRKSTGQKIMGFIEALAQGNSSGGNNAYGGGNMGGGYGGGGGGGGMGGMLGGLMGNQGGGGQHHSGLGGMLESFLEGGSSGGGGGNAGYQGGAGFGGGGGGGGYNAGGGGGGAGYPASASFGGGGFTPHAGAVYNGGTTPVRVNHAAASRDAGCLVSGCRDSETSADASPAGDRNKAFGALTNALTTTIKNNTTGRPLSNVEVVSSVRHFLAAGGFKQNPCLSCSERNANASFII